MLYHYIASNQEGKLVEAEYDAANLEGALRFLSSHGLTPVSVKAVGRARLSAFTLFGTITLDDKLFLAKYLSLMLRVGTDLLSAINILISDFDKAVGRARLSAFTLFGTITLDDKLFLAKYLSLMLRVGTDLLSAINILISDFDKAAMRNFLLEVRENISQGRPFHEVFARYPRVFSPVMINLIKAAELSGNLQKTFEELSVSLQKEADLKSKVRSALVYPIIVLMASGGIAIFLTTFALPRIAKAFLEGGIDPPTFSKIVFTIGLFMGAHVYSILIGGVGLIGFLIYFFAKNSIGRRIGERIMSHTPVVKNIYRNLAIQRFAATFASLLKAGLPIVEAMKITADVVGAEEFRLSLRRIADEGIAKGLTIGDAFRKEVSFPKVVVNLVAISEKAGHLEEVLDTLADFYASNVDNGIKAIVSFLEPALLLFMGFLVGTIALSIIVPIYQLTSQF